MAQTMEACIRCRNATAVCDDTRLPGESNDGSSGDKLPPTKQHAFHPAKLYPHLMRLLWVKRR